MNLLDSNIVIAAASRNDAAIDRAVLETAYSISVVTRNVDDFKHVTGLRLINPFTSVV